MAPTGPIKTSGIDGTWEDITRFDDWIHAAADPVGWPVARIRGTIAIESEGDPAAHQPNSQGDSYGLMQVVPFTADPAEQGWEGWHALVKQIAGLPANASRQKVINALYDPEVNIAVGVAILEQLYQQHGTLDAASSAFFTGNGTWDGEGDSTNKNTPAWYRKTINALIVEQRLFGDVIDRLFGGRPYGISAEYGQPVTWQCPIGVNPGQPGNCYEYQEAYGLDDVHHYAYDVSANAGDGAPLYAPFNGTVVCAGTGVGSGAWGTGCGFNARLNNYGGLPARAGSGRLELLHEDGRASLIIGHVLGSRVNPGDRVQAGDHIGYQGGMNASHVHLEGRYANGSRIGDPRVLFPLDGATPGAIPDDYPDSIDIPQPAEFDVSVEVTVTRDGVPVLQRADLNAEQTMPPLKKGDTFNAVYQALGNDLNIYWITTNRNRVPVEGTTAPDWKGGAPITTGTDPEAVAALVEGVRVDIDARLREVIESLSAA